MEGFIMMIDEYVDKEEYTRLYSNYFDLLYEHEQLIEYLKCHASLTYSGWKIKQEEDLKL
jgi:hypothetical protein